MPRLNSKSERPGSSAAKALYRSTDVDEYRKYLLLYDEAILTVSLAHKKPGLVSLDKWLHEEFASRGYDKPLLLNELSKIMVQIIYKLPLLFLEYGDIFKKL